MNKEDLQQSLSAYLAEITKDYKTPSNIRQQCSQAGLKIGLGRISEYLDRKKDTLNPIDVANWAKNQQQNLRYPYSLNDSDLDDFRKGKAVAFQRTIEFLTANYNLVESTKGFISSQVMARKSSVLLI